MRLRAKPDNLPCFQVQLSSNPRNYAFIPEDSPILEKYKDKLELFYPKGTKENVVSLHSAYRDQYLIYLAGIPVMLAGKPLPNTKIVSSQVAMTYFTRLCQSKIVKMDFEQLKFLPLLH